MVVLAHTRRKHVGEASMATQPLPDPVSSDLRQGLHGVKSAMRTYAKGAKLFQHGMPVDGVYIIESGQVRVLLPTMQRRLQLLETAGPGAILGLSETMSGDHYRVMVEACEPTTATFIPRENLMEFLRQHCDLCLQLVRLLSDDLHALYRKF